MNFKNLRELMDRFVIDNYAPGNTIKVYLGNNKVFDYSCGYSDIDKKIEMSGDEYFYLYSCSKITTVTAALQLLEKGIILLNDPLYEYIPEFKNMYIKTESGELIKAKKDITIQNLFNMTAGFTYNTDTDGIKKAYELTQGKMDTETVIRCMANDPLSFEPGEKFQYSMCHDVLAGLVSVVSGKKFRDYVKENIFEPLEMSSATYHLTPEIRKYMATQYRFVPQNDGEDFEKVYNHYYGIEEDKTTSSTASEAETTEEKTYKYPYASILAAKDSGDNYASELYDTVKALKNDEVKYIESETAITVLVRRDMESDELRMEDLCKTVLWNEKNEEFQKGVDEEAAKLSLDENTFATKRFKVKNIIYPAQ